MKYSSLCKILIISIVVFPSLVVAMTSENYEISQDSINFSGSDSSTSTNYKLDDTMGEVGTGFYAQCQLFYRNWLSSDVSGRTINFFYDFRQLFKFGDIGREFSFIG